MMALEAVVVSCRVICSLVEAYKATEVDDEMGLV